MQVGGWDPEPHIILETVGDTGLVYRVRPEKGGKENVLHRNSLKLCTGPLLQSRVAAPQTSEERHMGMPMLYYVPAPNMPTGIEET